VLDVSLHVVYLHVCASLGIKRRELNALNISPGIPINRQVISQYQIGPLDARPGMKDAWGNVASRYLTSIMLTLFDGSIEGSRG
jgi:hypothetical protein